MLPIQGDIVMKILSRKALKELVLLSAAHHSTRKGRQIPQEGNAGSEPCRLGETGSPRLVLRTLTHSGVNTLLLGAPAPRTCTLRFVNIVSMAHIIVYLV